MAARIIGDLIFPSPKGAWIHNLAVPCSWDAYDRMTQVSRTGQTTVNYKYDAMGRLLYRSKADSSVRTYYYYLGLNRIGEEERGAETGGDKTIFRPDTETSPTATDNGWYVCVLSASLHELA
jgi:YD repeat-containing protein